MTRSCTPTRSTRRTVWIREAEAQHQQVLVAFYHSEYTPHEAAERRALPARRAEIRQAVPPRPPVPGLGRGQPRQHPRRARQPLGGRATAEYYQALIRVCHGCTVIGLDVLDAQNIGPTLELHLRIQARDRRLRDDHAEDLGPAQLLRHQPPGSLAHARTRRGARRPGVADRDRRDRAVRRRLSQQARLRSDARGEGAQIHVRRRRLAAADQAPVHLRLDRRQRLDALRRRA